MRSMTATLTAAARARQRRPLVVAVIQDAQRRWSETWKDASSTTTRHVAACNGVLDATKIVRVRNNAGTIECQVITNPATAAQWTSWPIIVSTGHAAHTSSHVAIGKGEGNTLHCYYWKAGVSPNSIRCVVSSDDGATWSGNAEVKSTAPAGYVIATSGRADCWFIGGSPIRLAFRTRSAGVWSADSTNGTLTDISTGIGVAVVNDSNYSKYVYTVAYRTTATGNPYTVRVSSFDYASPAWSSVYFTLPPTMAGASQQRPQCPSMCRSVDGYIYMSLCELWSDGVNNYIDVTVWKCLGGAADNYQYWGDIALLNLPVANVCQIPLVERLFSSRYTLYVAGEFSVRGSVLFNTSDPDRYLEDDQVLAFHLDEDETIRRGWLDLSNEGNRYSQFGVAGQVGAAIKPLSQVLLQIGYITSAGEEYIELRPFYIETAELLYGPGQQPRLRLHLIGVWRLAEQWRAPYAMTFSSQTAKHIFKTLLALSAGVYATDDSSSAWGQTVGSFAVSAGRRQSRSWRWRSEYVSPDGVPLPVFQVDAGASGLEQLWKLLVLTGGKMRTGAAGWAYLCDLKAQSVGAIDYAIGANGEIEDAAYAVSVPGTNRARILASSGAIAEAWSDPATAEALGRMIESTETRNEITAQALAEEAAKGLTDEGRREGTSGQVRIPLVPGLELYDCVSVSDARVGLSAAKRRVISLVWLYDARRSVYHQLVGLGGLG